MAVMTPHFRWGSREVDWTWVPETSTEMAHTVRRLVGEGLGVLGFTFIAGSAIVVNQITDGGLGVLGMAAATGLGYAIMVSLFHPVSGGHINPAVTLGMVFGRRMPPFIGLLYLAAQFGGAVAGALLLNLIFDDFVSDASQTAMLVFDEKMGFWAGGLLEGILTFLLVVAYFRAFVDPRADRTFGPLSIGAVVLFAFLVAYPLTGAALNLARVFGTDLVAGDWTDFGNYLLPLIGGGAAGLLYEYLFVHHEEEEASAGT